MSALALSVLLSFISAVAYAGGAIVQEQVAVSSPGQQYAPMRRPIWWAAVALNGLGALLHVVALAYGPLSLVQPLGALTIVFALPMAALFVGRKAGATAWRGAIMATVGLAGLLSLVGASDAQSLDTTQRVGVAVVTAGAVVALMIAGRAAHRHPAVRSILLAIASGIAFGMSSVFTKTVAVDWTGGVSAADVPSLAVIGVLATTGMLLSQAAYRGAGLAAPLATLTVVNPVAAAAVGITMFGETFRYGTTGTALALSCGVVAAGGLILLTTERLQRTHPEPVEPLPEPTARPVAPLPEPVPAEGRQARRFPDQPVAAGVRDGVLVPTPATAAVQEATLLPAPSAATIPDSVPAPAAAAVPDGVLVPVPVSPSALDGDTGTEDAAERAASSASDVPAYLYGPFHAGLFVPLPVVDRHRTRVKS
ncbi:DMT family transporter [Streptomyces sp. AC555_RSS877]|uniref:DMT family transporter n=1 Tax=Streptomyces sp. AC555_RSS877 TaxID=2823688 RepID=UPI001C2595DB|nr:DMT family transporter [Streptomyces sp. AC555_RSS877]